MLKRINARIRAFANDRSGNIAMLFGLLFIFLFTCVGGAIDYGRWMHARYHTARALDAAVLAGGRTLQLDSAHPAAALAAAQNVYASNVTKRLSLINDTVQFVTADNNLSVTAQGSASLKTIILGVIGINALPVAGTAGSRFPKAKLTAGGSGSGNIEVVMMLDTTGSMCDDGNGPCVTSAKLDALKTGAKSLIDIVVQSTQTPYTSRVGIVPFATRVRVGPDSGGGAMMAAMTDLPASWSGYYQNCTQSTWTPPTSSEHNGVWTCTQYATVPASSWPVMPCVTDRMYDSGSYDYTDRAPGHDYWLNAHGGDRMPYGPDASNASPGTEIGVTSAHPSSTWNFNSAGNCDDIAQTNEIMPLSSDKIALKARIDYLEAYGSTSGALGTAMTWYMLSPNWHNVWPSPSRPGNYSDLTNIQSNGRPRLRKVAVLMTDGVYNTWRGWKDQDQQSVSNHAKQLCTNMKAAGVEVYTVGFALNLLTPTERAIATNTLQSCGTDLQHFYDTLTLPDLQNAFRDIALSLTTVYLSD